MFNRSRLAFFSPLRGQFRLCSGRTSSFTGTSIGDTLSRAPGKGKLSTVGNWQSCIQEIAAGRVACILMSLGKEIAHFPVQKLGPPRAAVVSYAALRGIVDNGTV